MAGRFRRPWWWPGAERISPAGHELARSLSAGRAALFAESIEAGDPELAVSATAVGQLLIERHGVSAELVAQSGAAYRAWRRQGAEPSARLASELGRAVRALPAYRAG